MKIRLFLLLTASMLASGACLPAIGERILGRDLAQADPRFSALPATLAVGFAPAPGMRRIYAAEELRRIARANRIQWTDGAEICFEVPMRRLSAEDATAAMRRGLPPDATLTIEELSQADLPAGELEFPVSGLEPPSPTAQGVQLWRGYARYAGARKASCWARVKLTVRYTAVVTAQDLQPGQTLEPALLRVETRTGTLSRAPAATSIDQVKGRAVKRSLPAGSPVPLGILIEAPAVHRGDTVSVEVRSGPARLHFDAVAEAPAREGDVIELHNPINGKPFKARLTGERQAVVVVGAEQEL